MISDWSTRFNVKVIRCEDRPDRPAGDIVYRLIDLFTTESGSWEPSDKLGAVTPWAREKYLRPLSAPDFFDDAGGDHHLFARVLDASGRPMVAEGLVRFWSDGLERLGDPHYNGFISVTPKQHSGWANQPVFNSFSPERGERGAWCWCPKGPSDVVAGGGLPNNHHISFFAVWQAAPRQGTAPRHPQAGTTTDRDRADQPIVDQPVDKQPVQEQPVTADLGAIRRQVWQASGLAFNQATPFVQYARAHNLGAPLTAEIDVGGFRVQGFANAIVYAPQGQWERASHTDW